MEPPTDEERDNTFHNRAVFTPVKQLLDQLTDGVFLRNEVGEVVVNAALARILGISGDEPLDHQEFVALLCGLCSEESRTALENLLNGESGGEVLCRVAKDQWEGETIQVTLTPCPIFPRSLHWGVIVIKREGLGASTEQLHALALMKAVLDGISDAILIVDENSLTIQKVNRSALRVFRAHNSQLIGKPIRELFRNPSRADEIVPSLDIRLRALGSLHIDTDMVRMDGEVFPSLISISPIEDPRGYRLALLWVISDVSHRVFLNRSHYELETRYRHLFNRIGDPTFIIDAGDGTILDCNQAAEEHLGYSRTQLLKMKVTDITPLERLEGMKQDLSQVKPGEGATFEGINLTRTGEKIPVMVTTVATELHGKKVFIATTRDVSAQKALEAQKLEMEKLKSIRQTAGGLVHEISQPLQALMTLTDILENLPPDRWNSADLINRLRTNVDRLSQLANNIKKLTSTDVKTYIEGVEIIKLEGEQNKP